MKKRILAVILSMALSAACLTACGEDNKQEKDKAETTTTTTTKNTTAHEVIVPTDPGQTTTEGYWHTESTTTTTTTSKTTTTTTTTKKNTTEQYVKPLKPEEKPNENGYWHTESTTKATTKATTTTTKATTKKTTTAANKKITAADLKAAAEAELARISAAADEGGWPIVETRVMRNTNTQYGIYAKFVADSENWSHTIIKAEVRNGTIAVFYSAQPMGVTSIDYESYSLEGPIDELIDWLREKRKK